LLALTERLAEEMARRWRAGEQPLAEEYLAGHPELEADPRAALELVAEEIYLRAETGQELAAGDFAGRFPHWQRQVLALLDCHQFMSPQVSPPRFPAAGETLGDFRLLSELGRGACGRVFLARQSALANRWVVLKLASDAGREHLSLSRLQHTHIVPLHSVHDFPERGLRGLCQPHFGGTSLAELLRRLEDVPAGERSGPGLLHALEQAGAGAPVVVPVKGPACQFLARATYVEAVCWIGACLADALHYAHERGLLHLDPKPSNVLLAADGQPMLLDFHLARAPLEAGHPAPSGLGGTPGYMAPEHQAALAAVAAHHDIPMTVDRRADVYALGMLLYGALGGTVPAPLERPGEELRRRNPRVSGGLADLLTRCLAANPASRYASAAELAADLRRHLADRPLHGVANRSLAERWRKWRRRRPFALPLAALLLAGVAAGGLLLGQVLHQGRAAAAAWQRGADHLRQQRYDKAFDVFKQGVVLAEDLPFGTGLRRQLRDGVDEAERGQLAGELHQLCERLRPLYGADFLPKEQSRQVADQCNALWRQRELIVGRLGHPPTPAIEQQLQTDLLDLALLSADLRVRLAPPQEVRAARKETLEVLSQAEALFGPSRVLYEERRAHTLALGLTDEAETAAQQGAALAPHSAWEHYALGRTYLRAGDLALAAEELEHAVALQPEGLWSNFYQGICAYRRGRFDDALLAFSVSVALAPRSASCVYNRGRTFAQVGNLDRALQDYDRALQLDPALGAAALGRAEVHCRQQHHDEALRDLDLALRAGAEGAVVAYQQALVHLGRQDRSAAVISLHNALRLDPGHRQARDLLARLESVP
jgi:tetratricopeptide (TPR) repeat protein